MSHLHKTRSSLQAKTFFLNQKIQVKLKIHFSIYKSVSSLCSSYYCCFITFSYRVITKRRPLLLVIKLIRFYILETNFKSDRDSTISLNSTFQWTCAQLVAGQIWMNLCFCTAKGICALYRVVIIYSVAIQVCHCAGERRCVAATHRKDAHSGKERRFCPCVSFQVCVYINLKEEGWRGTGGDTARLSVCRSKQGGMVVWKRATFPAKLVILPRFSRHVDFWTVTNYDKWHVFGLCEQFGCEWTFDMNLWLCCAVSLFFFARFVK